MAEGSSVTGFPREVTFTATDGAPRFTPRELTMVKDHFGKSFTQIIGEEDQSDDRFILIAWLKLRRDGYTLTLDDMQDVVIYPQADEEPDPTNGVASTVSPPSASSGV